MPKTWFLCTLSNAHNLRPDCCLVLLLKTTNEHDPLPVSALDSQFWRSLVRMWARVYWDFLLFSANREKLRRKNSNVGRDRFLICIFLFIIYRCSNILCAVKHKSREILIIEETIHPSLPSDHFQEISQPTFCIYVLSLLSELYFKQIE